MSGINFDNDTQARRLLWGVLLGSLLVLLLALLLYLIHIPVFAVCGSGLMLVAFIGAFIWLYRRYSSLPLVKERVAFTNRAVGIRAKITTEDKKINSARQHRAELPQKRAAELATALKDLQEGYIRSGLAGTLIADAKIPGIGPKLKERLAARGIITAADINARVTGIEGFGEAKTQAVLAWHSGILSQFHQSKPTALPTDQADSIDKKYVELHAKNDAAESASVEEKKSHEAELEGLVPRLAELAPYVFTTYLARSLSPQGASNAKGVGFPLLLSLPIGSAVLITMCGFLGLSSVLANASSASPTVPIDYNAIGTSAFETALASGFSTLDARTPTSRPIATSVAQTPTSTATISPPVMPTEFAGITGVSCIPSNPPQYGKVVDVVDGDTIKVLLDDDGKTYSLRYIGMDTPEMSSGQLYAAEAKARNSELVYGKRAILIKDVSETDRYDRLLRYVIVGNSFVNYDLVAQGYARSASYPPDTACIPSFQQAEQIASGTPVGIWALPPTAAPLPLATSPSNGGPAPCNCDGPDLNCSHFSSHADAQACYSYCVSQGYGNIFGLDGNDNDGFACESLP